VHAGGGLPATTPIVPFGGFETATKHVFAQPMKKTDKKAKRTLQYR
jgi:hypothetical protein